MTVAEARGVFPVALHAVYDTVRGGDITFHLYPNCEHCGVTSLTRRKKANDIDDVTCRFMGFRCLSCNVLRLAVPEQMWNDWIVELYSPIVAQRLRQ